MTDEDRRLSRRRLLRGALTGGSGLLAAYVVGCSDGDDAQPEQTATPSRTAAPTRAVTGVPTPSPEVMRWRKIALSGALPPGRRDHSLVTDGKSLLVFGGRNESGDLGDLWAYGVGATSWGQPFLGEGPAARFGHNAVFDTRLGGMVVFGGQAGGFFNDVWVLENAGWRLIEATGPSERYGAASALDVNGRLVISHGFTNEGRFDDTWALASAGAWADISASGTRPIKRCLIRGVWDAKRDRFLIFGGQTDGTPFLGDLWALDANGWAEITSEPKPSPRNFYAMAETDPGRIVLFGGNSREGPGPVNDLWFLGTANDTWTQVQVEGEAPSPRYGHDAVWLPDNRKLIVFGGHDASGDVNDLWELSFPA